MLILQVWTAAPRMGSVAQALPELVGCRKWTLTAVLALGFMAEMADNSILQALYAPVGRALHASAVQLGTLTMWRGLVQVPGPMLPHRCCRALLVQACACCVIAVLHVMQMPEFCHTTLFCIF